MWAAPNKLIKLASEPLSKPFTVIYNESILTGKVPELFKISKVTPICKSGAVTKLGNYRPITVISTFSKVLERLVYQQLVSFLEKQCLLFNFQFFFRKGYLKPNMPFWKLLKTSNQQLTMKK